jgi:hypothetical protein
MMNFAKIVFESKDVIKFKAELKNLVSKDPKAKTLFKAFQSDADKVVDYIDYVMSKYPKDLDALMNKTNINYDEAVDILVKGI